MNLPTDPAERKATPIYSGVLMYFPRAIAEIARVSKAGNDQHNPGQPLHWAREKSTDHHDCIARHLLEAGSFDTDGQRHSAKLAWRALAALEIELERCSEPAAGDTSPVDASPAQATPYGAALGGMLAGLHYAQPVPSERRKK